MDFSQQQNWILETRKILFKETQSSGYLLCRIFWKIDNNEDS